MNSRTSTVVALLLIVVAQALHAQSDRARACTALADTALSTTSITAVELITGGSFTPPGSTNAITNLPPFGAVRIRASRAVD